MEQGAQPRHYPFFSALWNGFYNREFYVHAITRWRGACFGYIALVTALICLPILVALHGQLSHMHQVEIPYMLEQMPVITLKQGKAQIDSDEPVTIYDSTGRAAVMVDTQGKYRSPETAGVVALVTQDAIMLQKNNNETRSYSLSEVDNTIIDREYMRNFVEHVWPFIMPVGALLMLIGVYIWRLIQLVFFALVALAISRMLAMQLEFFAMMQVSAVALGAMLLIDMVAAYVLMPLPAAVGFLVVVFYVWFGLKAARDWAKAQIQLSPPPHDREV